MPGWVKLHRDIVMKDIYLKDPLYTRVFERLIIEANHNCKRIPYKGGTKLIKRGERLTSIRQIAEWVGWYERGIFKTPNPKTISKILDWMVEHELIEIFNKGNAQETHYNVLNYWFYQSKDDDESNAKVTVDGSVSKQSVDTNKNDKNDKKINKESLDGFFDTLWKLYPKKEGKGQVSKTQKEKLYKIGIDEMTRAINRYVQAKTGKDKQYLQNGSTFFNSGYVDYMDANYQDKPHNGPLGVQYSAEKLIRRDDM